MWPIAVVADVGLMNGSFRGERIHTPDPELAFRATANGVRPLALLYRWRTGAAEPNQSRLSESGRSTMRGGRNRRV
jgi:hypothetical protein